ncbi:MAG: TolC family protein [Bacteroidales bacterium]|nr:TolC family protein [Bacteroidales bacterium]
MGKHCHTEAERIKKEITAEVKSSYYQWIFIKECLDLLQEEKERLSDLERIANVNFELGEITLLEK